MGIDAAVEGVYRLSIDFRAGIIATLTNRCATASLPWRRFARPTIIPFAPKTAEFIDSRRAIGGKSFYPERYSASISIKKPRAAASNYGETRRVNRLAVGMVRGIRGNGRYLKEPLLFDLRNDWPNSAIEVRRGSISGPPTHPPTHPTHYPPAIQIGGGFTEWGSLNVRLTMSAASGPDPPLTGRKGAISVFRGGRGEMGINSYCG